MKDFMLGFLSCAVLFLFIGATSKISNRYKKEIDIWNEMETIYTDFQPKQFTIKNSTPSVNSLRKGEIIIVSSGNVTNLFTRVQQSTFSVALERK